MAPAVSMVLADVVAPMDAPLIADGAVAYREGVIVAVGARHDLLRQHRAERIDDLGPAVLTPGLVNAHVHLELSTLRCGAPAASFVEWLKRLIPRGLIDADALRDFVQRGTRAGAEESIRFGVATVGDISRHCAITRQLLRDGPLRVVSFGEVQAMAQRRAFLEERLATAADQSYRSETLSIGISPHAPYSVEIDGFARCAELAGRRALPLATHLAESADEAAFLANHRGPFRELWRFLDAWDDAVPHFAGGPIRMARDAGLLAIPSVLAHVNYCDDQEMQLLACGRASVVYCPRTHAYFGHPPHRWRDMLAAGINVAIGTDSRASSPDLNLLDDLRLMHREAPDVPVIELWRMGTIRGAAALGMQDRVGSLAVGKAADLVAFPLLGQDPLAALLETSRLPVAMWIAGQLV